MKVAILSTVAWSTPPEHYGAYENVASVLTEGLVKKGIDVTLFATGNSKTNGQLEWLAPKGYEEDKTLSPKVWELMHIANFFEQSFKFDIIHNMIDIVPISYSHLVDVPLVTTFHAVPSEANLPLYKRFNDEKNYYVAPSISARKKLNFSEVIYHGIDIDQYPFCKDKDNYLFCMARIHPEKGIHNAIKIARASGMKLYIAGIIQDQDYFDKEIKPFVDGDKVQYIGAVGGSKKTDLLSKAYAFLHPIECEEAFGLTVVEAQACGTPVIAFDRGSIPEVVSDKKTGYVVKDIEAAVEAIKKIDLIDKTECRNFVKDNFSQEIMANNYIKLYERILREKK